MHYLIGTRLMFHLRRMTRLWPASVPNRTTLSRWPWVRKITRSLTWRLKWTKWSTLALRGHHYWKYILTKNLPFFYWIFFFRYSSDWSRWLFRSHFVGNSPKIRKLTYEWQIRTTCTLLCWQHALNISKLFVNNCDPHNGYNGGTSDRPTRYVRTQDGQGRKIAKILQIHVRVPNSHHV